MPALRTPRRRATSGAARSTPPGDRGSSSVELAILMPAILLALFAGIQVALFFLARTVALSAAQEATTAERAYNAPAGVGYERANTFLGQVQDWLVDPQVTITRSDGQVESTVTGTALSVIPGVSFAVSQTAHGSIERFTTEEQP